MDLAAQQRKLLGLFRDTYWVGADDDAYIRKVAQSKHLEEGRRNVLLWRTYVLERTCALSIRLLRHRNLLEETLKTFIARTNISPFRETQAPAFLEALSVHSDGLIASVAQFELSLMRVKQGDPRSYLVSWNIEPHSILHSLARNTPLEGEIAEGAYQILISRDIPGQFQIFYLRDEDGHTTHISR